MTMAGIFISPHGPLTLFIDLRNFRAVVLLEWLLLGHEPGPKKSPTGIILVGKF